MSDEFKAKGNAALQAGNVEQAVNFYTEGIEVDSGNHVLFSNRSAAFAKLERYAEALADAEKTVTLKPDWAKGYSRVGAALTFLERHGDAVEAYEKAVNIDPNNATYKTGLSDAKDRVEESSGGGGGGGGNPFAGPQVFAKLAADPRTQGFLQQPDYMQMLSMLQQNPSNLSQFLADPRFQTTLSVILGVDFSAGGGAFSGAGETPGSPPKTTFAATAAKSTSSARAETKSNSAPAPEPELNDADQEKQLGNEAYKKKDFEAALTHYDNAIELDATNLTYLTNKAAVFFEQGRLDECREICVKAVDIGREHHADFKHISKALGRIGSVHYKREEYEEAIKWFNKSLSEHRTSDILKKQLQANKFLEEQRRVEYLSPEIALEERTKGNDAYHKGDYPTAIRHYTESAKRNPDDPKVYSNRAACYTKLAEFRMGLDDCDTVLRLDPTFVKGFTRKAMIHLALKEPSKALAAFQEALTLDPNNAEAQAGIRKAYETSPTNMTDAEREQVAQRAMADPEVQSIMQDPAMRTILNQMQEDPKAVREHLRNPVIGAKIQKLVDSGLISMR